jgi:hypothetical protein
VLQTPVYELFNGRNRSLAFAATNPNRGCQSEGWSNIAERALAALENGQPSRPVEQIKEAAIVGGDVVALDAL